jgi:hypothetical protein
MPNDIKRTQHLAGAISNNIEEALPRKNYRAISAVRNGQLIGAAAQKPTQKGAQ